MTMARRSTCTNRSKRYGRYDQANSLARHDGKRCRRPKTVGRNRFIAPLRRLKQCRLMIPYKDGRAKAKSIAGSRGRDDGFRFRSTHPTRYGATKVRDDPIVERSPHQWLVDDIEQAGDVFRAHGRGDELVLKGVRQRAVEIADLTD